MEDDFTMKFLDYKGNLMTAIEKDGKLCFVPNEICQVLGFNIEKLIQAQKSLEDDEKVTIYFKNTNGEMDSYTIINEFGVYTLIFQSPNKKEAKEFLRWIRREISRYENRYRL